MRKEYDLNKGERGKFYGKVDTKNPIIEDDVESSTEEIISKKSDSIEILDELPK